MKTSVQQKMENIFKITIDVIGFLLQAIYLILKYIYELFLPSTYQHKKNIIGDVVLVTGGGGGLGRLISLRLAKLGATVVLWDVDAKALEETAHLIKGLGGIVHAYKCDIADKDDVYRIAKKTQEEVGYVSILVNNAGVSSGYALLDTPDHLIKRTFDVNSVAHFWTVKAFLPKMIEMDNGHIVSIASMAGYVGTHKMVDYCASKYAVVGFDEAFRAELDWLGIKCIKTTMICPFFVQQTGMFNKVVSNLIPPLKPNDVADRIVEAIMREEVHVTIPAAFNYFLWLKMMVPHTINSLMIRSIVGDPTPQSQSLSEIKKSIEALSKKRNGTVTSSVSQSKNKLYTQEKDQ